MLAIKNSLKRILKLLRKSLSEKETNKDIRKQHLRHQLGKQILKMDGCQKNNKKQQKIKFIFDVFRILYSLILFSNEES